MTNKKDNYTVLMLDDDMEYAKSITDKAKKYRVILKTKTNVEEGIEELKRNNKKYQAVILDGKFLLEKDQQKGQETGSAVHKAIRELDKLSHEGHIFPYCILSAHLAELKDTLQEHKCFSKVSNNEGEKDVDNKIWKYLITEIKKNPETGIRQTHTEIFRFAGKYLDNEDVGNLLDLLRDDLSEDERLLKKKLAFIRHLVESLYYKLGRILLDIDPLELDKSDKPEKEKKLSNTKIIIERCRGDLNVPNYIHFFALNIYSLASREVLHKKPKSSINAGHKITQYTVRAVINSLLDVMMWASAEIKEKDTMN